MPWKPAGPCHHPGCPNRAISGHHFCKEHDSENKGRERSASDRMYDRYARNPEHRKRYHSGDWAAISRRYRSAHPFCELCLQHDRYILAELVHHIVPLDEGGTNDWSNLQSLCSACHNVVHHQMRKQGTGTVYKYN